MFAGKPPPQLNQLVIVTEYVNQLNAALDRAIAISLDGDPANRAAYIAHISLVKGVPFYGYHVGYRPFLKIYYTEPGLASRIADILLAGAVMSTPLQPHEAHLPYLLQFLIDYNLYGMSSIVLSGFHFRGPLPESCKLK